MIEQIALFINESFNSLESKTVTYDQNGYETIISQDQIIVNNLLGLLSTMDRFSEYGVNATTLQITDSKLPQIGSQQMKDIITYVRGFLASPSAQFMLDWITSIYGIILKRYITQKSDTDTAAVFQLIKSDITTRTQKFIESASARFVRSLRAKSKSNESQEFEAPLTFLRRRDLMTPTVRKTYDKLDELISLLADERVPQVVRNFLVNDNLLNVTFFMIQLPQNNIPFFTFPLFPNHRFYMIDKFRIFKIPFELKPNPKDKDSFIRSLKVVLLQLELLQEPLEEDSTDASDNEDSKPVSRGRSPAPTDSIEQHGIKRLVETTNVTVQVQQGQDEPTPTRASSKQSSGESLGNYTETESDPYPTGLDRHSQRKKDEWRPRHNERKRLRSELQNLDHDMSETIDMEAFDLLTSHALLDDSQLLVKYLQLNDIHIDILLLLIDRFRESISSLKQEQTLRDLNFITQKNGVMHSLLPPITSNQLEDSDIIISCNDSTKSFRYVVHYSSTENVLVFNRIIENRTRFV